MDREAWSAQSMGSQRVRHDWATELNWTVLDSIVHACTNYSWFWWYLNIWGFQHAVLTHLNSPSTNTTPLHWCICFLPFLATKLYHIFISLSICYMCLMLAISVCARGFRLLSCLCFHLLPPPLFFGLKCFSLRRVCVFQGFELLPMLSWWNIVGGVMTL